MKNNRIFSYLFLSISAFITTFLMSGVARANGLAKPWEITLQPPGSPVDDRIVHLHHMLMTIITGIVVFVTVLLAIVIIRFRAKANPVPSKVTHNTALEILWTAVPVLILVVIAIPSMKLLFYENNETGAKMTINAIGNQWYWSYKYPDNGISFSSYIVPDKDLKPGQPRLLTTDAPVVLPVNTKVEVHITSNDVIHSWAVPSLGIKTDAIPGRVNKTWLEINKPGYYYGQCSQLCGNGHGFMPIEIHAVSAADFAKWVKSKGGKMATSDQTQATTQKTKAGE